MPPAGMYAPSMRMGAYSTGMMSTMYPGMDESFRMLSDQGKGKGKSREADFEAAFAHVAASFSTTQTESPRIVEVEDGVTDIEEVLQKAHLNESGTESDFQKYYRASRTRTMLMP